MFGKKAETEVVEEVEHELKFKEWFTFVMGLFFFGGDAVIAFILKALGMD